MMSGRHIAFAATGVIAALFSLWAIPSMVENLDANEIMVIQSVSGELNCYTDPGPKMQNFGKVTIYPRRGLYAFDKEATSKKLRFNDGGHANLYGSVQWEMPLDCKAIVAAHKQFGSAEGIQTAAVSKMLDAAIYLAGPLMSSTESSGERRSELVQYINDQAEKGVYVTQVREKEVVDPLSGVKKEVAVTEILRGTDGQPRRQQGSMLQEFNIKLLPMSIADIKYDDVVEKQIAERQKATTQVQIALANAKRAEQDALTATKQGEVAIATARAAAETVKAKAVTEAQQRLTVAELAAKEAEQYKREQILRGEGDSQRKQLVMNADGALDQKLQAYIEVNKTYASAIANAQPGAWTPVTMFGGSGGTGGAGNASNLIDLFTAKAARDLGVDMAVSGKAATAKK